MRFHTHDFFRWLQTYMVQLCKLMKGQTQTASFESK